MHGLPIQSRDHFSSKEFPSCALQRARGFKFHSFTTCVWKQYQFGQSCGNCKFPDHNLRYFEEKEKVRLYSYPTPSPRIKLEKQRKEISDVAPSRWLRVRASAAWLLVDACTQGWHFEDSSFVCKISITVFLYDIYDVCVWLRWPSRSVVLCLLPRAALLYLGPYFWTSKFEHLTLFYDSSSQEGFPIKGSEIPSQEYSWGRIACILVQFVCILRSRYQRSNDTERWRIEHQTRASADETIILSMNRLSDH